MLRFTQPLDRSVAQQVDSHFAQCWNYRYSAAYGSPEFSPSHPGTPGHDPVHVASAHVTPDGRGLFLELPDLQPVNQLHLHLGVAAGTTRDLIVTVHRLDTPYTQFPGYHAVDKTIAAHPILSDLALATKRIPNPWRTPIRGAREILTRAGRTWTFFDTLVHREGRRGHQADVHKSRRGAAQLGSPEAGPVGTHRRLVEQTDRRPRSPGPPLRPHRPSRSGPHRHRRPARKLHNLFPRAQGIRTIPVPLHLPRALDGDEWADGCGVRRADNSDLPRACRARP